MSDLIKREDAMGAVQDHFNADGFRGYVDGQKIMDRINALPSADAVQIVRCKDCKWYNCNACFRDDGAENHRNSEDFCSYGERKQP